MATTWTITRRQGTCAETGHEFGDGERHVSMLRVVEGALERSDLSLPAWRDLRSRIDSEESPEVEPLFWWMTRHEVTKKKTVALDMESLAGLFVQLEGREEVQVRELRYVLCLLLMRKRRVKVEKVLRENDEESFIVKRPHDDTRYKVYVYDFEPERLDEVRAQLQAVFDGAEGPNGIQLSPEDDSVDGEAEFAEGPEGAPEGALPPEEADDSEDTEESEDADELEGTDELEGIEESEDTDGSEDPEAALEADEADDTDDTVEAEDIEEPEASADTVDTADTVEYEEVDDSDESEDDE